MIYWSMNAAVKTLQQLPVVERLQAVEDLWDSIAADSQQDLGLSSEQRVELDERLDDLEANPQDNLRWEEVRSKILAEL
jgi:putative addiction module component (TIGR02574 family)